MRALKPRTYKLVFDRDDKRPYCPLLQAAMGGDYHAVSRYFDSEFWHVAPTRNPIGVEGTVEELTKINEWLRAHAHGNQDPIR